MEISTLRLKKNSTHALIIAFVLAGFQYWQGSLEVATVVLSAALYLVFAAGLDVVNEMLLTSE